jgi:hypothetical protein
VVDKSAVIGHFPTNFPKKVRYFDRFAGELPKNRRENRQKIAKKAKNRCPLKHILDF